MRKTEMVSVALLLGLAVVWRARQVAVPTPGVMSNAPSAASPAAPPRAERPLVSNATPAVPGVDPAILKRALSPPSRYLPPEARPRVIANGPSSEVWQELQRQQHAVAQ